MTTAKKPPAEALASPPETTDLAMQAGRPAALTPQVLRDLRRPFTADAIRFKPQVISKTKDEGMATFYIDARLAAERLNTVVGPENWSDSYTVLFHDQAQAHAAFQFPVECSLTVFGVTKVDVGNYQKAKADDKAVKSAYSDALKRAAVKFGVGAYLYGLPKVWAQVKIVGEGQQRKAVGFTPAGEAQLKKAYERILRDLAARFGEPIDHGDLSDPDTQDGAPEEQHDDTPPPAAPVADAGTDVPDAVKRDGRIHVTDKEQIVGMVALAREAGFNDEEVQTILSNEREATGGHYRKKWLTEQLQYLNAEIAAKAAA